MALSLKDLKDSITNYFNPSTVKGIGDNSFKNPIPRVQQSIQNFAQAHPVAAQQALRTQPLFNNIGNTLNNPPIIRLQQYNRIQNPIGHAAATFGLGFGESILNSPANYVKGMTQTGFNLADSYNGRKVTPLQYLGGAAPTGEALLNVASFGIGSNIAKSGVKYTIKQAIKRGAAVGAGYGGSYGALQGLENNTNNNNTFNALKSIAGSTAAGAAGGAILGAGLSGSGALVGSIANKLKAVYKAGHPNASEAEASTAVSKFARNEIGQFAKKSRPANEPVFYGDMRQSIGASRNGDYLQTVADKNPIGFQAKPIGGNQAIMKAQANKGEKMVTLYHGSPNMPTKGNWRKGTYFADTEQNARYYASSHHNGDINVQKVEIPQRLLHKNNTNNIHQLLEEYPISKSAVDSGTYKLNQQTGKTFAKWDNTSATPRGFTTSVQEAPNLKSKTKFKVTSTYSPKANSQLQNEARALLSDGAQLDFTKIQNADQKVAATIQEAINMDKRGNHTAAANLLNNLSEQGTELGRGVQAFSLLDKMSPQAIGLSVAGKIKRYNQTAMRKIPELTGEQQSIISKQVDQIRKLKLDSRERNIAINELNYTINSFIPSSLADKALTVWKAGLLTSLRTHERNFLGNTIHGAAEIAKDPFAAGADILMSKRTGSRKLTPTLKGIGEFGSKETRQQMADSVILGYDPAQQISKFDYKSITWGNNPIEQGLKTYTGLVYRTLGASDKPFYNAAMARSLYDQAGAAAINAGRKGDAAFIEQLVKKPTPEMLKIAIGDANTATFKNKNAATSISSALKREMASRGGEFGKIASEITMPFTGVPSSILGQVQAYSPIGLIKGMVKTGRVVAGQVPELQRQAAQELGRGVIGTGIFGLGAYLASKGLITGQPKDATEARQWELENKPRNSIMIGGKWRSLNSIGPESIVFLAGSKLNEEMNNPEGFDTGGYALTLGKDQLDQSFLTGLQAPVNALTDPVRYGKSYAGNTISSVIPNFLKDTAKSADPFARETNTVMDYAQAQTPIARQSLLPRRDTLGNPIAQEPTGIGAFTDVFNSKTPISNSVVDELSRLNATGNNATPGKLNSTQTLAGVKTKLTPKELDTLESQIGSKVRQDLNALISDPSYQSLSDEDKSKAIDNVVAAARKQVRSGKPDNTTSNTATGDSSYTLVSPSGTTKQIDLSKPIDKPTLTGNTTLDKKLTTSYQSALTTRGNDIVALYKAGKIDAPTAEAELNKLNTTKTLSGTKTGTTKVAKAKKGKKMGAIKIAKVKPIKTSKIKFKLSKAPKVKIGKNTIKITKSKVTKSPAKFKIAKTKMKFSKKPTLS